MGMPQNDDARVRFGPGQTDVMPWEQAEYVLFRFYQRKRAIFAGYMRDYYLDREGGPGADRERAPKPLPVPGRGPGRPRAVAPAEGSEGGSG
jgi:hypothetical protein